jgi:hypothetical protein
MFTQKSILFATVASSFASLAFSACPNRCNGHGKCQAFDKCHCHPGFQGADCSERGCPYSRAWSDTAQANDDAHHWAECGNRGTCDRSSGECECNEGFTGIGCARMTCPNDCSGHGTCEFIEDLATDAYDKRIAGTAGVTYASWDQEKIMGCKCDPYYEGHDCSARMCPRGDDPVSTEIKTNMKQVITLGSGTDGHDFFLTYFDSYGNAWNTATIDNKASADTCTEIKNALKKLPNHAFYDITVTSFTLAWTKVDGARSAIVNTDVTGPINTAAVSTGTAATTCMIEFPNESGTTGVQHLLGCTQSGHKAAGSQPVLPSGSTSTACTVFEYADVTGSAITALPLRENAVCANRGLCDSSSGMCECFDGHTGVACELQEALV